MDKQKKQWQCYPETPLTKEEIHREIKTKVSRIDKEFAKAFEFIKDIPRSVTMFGSARFDETNDHYAQARRLASRIAKELGYTLLTGGGGGIMEAGNRGASEAGGESAGLNIRLPKEQYGNGYTTKSMEFYYFFIRKVALSFAAEAYIFFPGGFGTLDEFFEIVTLIQTKKIHRVPVFLVGADYWNPLDDFIKKTLLGVHHTISPEDTEIYTVTDDEDEIIKRIREAPVYDALHRHQKTKPEC